MDSLPWAVPIDTAGVAHRDRYLDEGFPDNPPEEDELSVLAARTRHNKCTQQTMAFTDLPAEIRNRVYEYALPAVDVPEGLIIESPCYDELMQRATHPAITRANRQLRTESLPMFYAANAFVAYISKMDFTPLLHWIECITSGPTPPEVTVHIKLMNRMVCPWQLLGFAKAWRDIDHSGVHLRIHNCMTHTTVEEMRARRQSNIAQKELVAASVNLAEELKAAGKLSDDDLVARYSKQVVSRCLGRLYCSLRNDGKYRCKHRAEVANFDAKVHGEGRKFKDLGNGKEGLIISGWDWSQGDGEEDADGGDEELENLADFVVRLHHH